MSVFREWIKRSNHYDGSDVIPRGGYWHCTCDNAAQQQQCDLYGAGEEEYCRWCYDEDGGVWDHCRGQRCWG